MPRVDADFQNFTGGLNTVSSNDALAENEFPYLKNIELGDRGSLTRRYGMKRYFEPTVQGKGQGFFRLHRRERKPLEIFAINGKLYQRPFDEIVFNEKQPYEFDSAGSYIDDLGNTITYRIVQVEVGNALAPSPITVTSKSGISLSVVSNITRPDQIMLASDGSIKISLADSETGWTSDPSEPEIQEKFFGKDIVITYPVKSTEIVIEGLPKGFQTTRPIEAVQYKDKLFIATGTKFCEFDGINASIVEPHKPDPLEALYVGTNALADDPSNFMADGVANNLRIDGITTDLRIGIINKPTVLKIYTSKPPSIAQVEYKYMYRKVGDTTWIMGRDWSITREWSFIPNSIGDYEFDCFARDKAVTTVTAEFIVPKYAVKERDVNQKTDFSAIQRCNRVIVHWERLILYGDDMNSSFIFVSHLSTPDFFPTPNTLQFDNKQIEPLTSLVRYRDMLVCFTPTSIQALYGKSPDDFNRVVLHTGIGCISNYTAFVTGNYITFLSKDGMYILQSVGTNEDKANVSKVDTKVANLITTDPDACAIVVNGQYQLYYPSRKQRLRLYFEQGGAWTLDESDKLDFVQVQEWDSEIYGQSQRTGMVMKFDRNTFDDDGFIYEDRIETKEFDFGRPYSKKKIKQVKFLIRSFEKEINLSVFVYADTKLIVNPDTSHAIVNSKGEVEWVASSTPNITVKAGTVMGAWEMGRDALGKKDSDVKFLRVQGRCRRTKIVISHTEDTPNSLLGFGYAFIMADGNVGVQGASNGSGDGSGGSGGNGGSGGSGSGGFGGSN